MESLEICFSGWRSTLWPIAELTIDSEAAAGFGARRTGAAPRIVLKGTSPKEAHSLLFSTARFSRFLNTLSDLE